MRLSDIIRVGAAVDCVADEVVVLVGNDGSVEVIVDVAVPRSAIAPGLEPLVLPIALAKKAGWAILSMKLAASSD